MNVLSAWIMEPSTWIVTGLLAAAGLYAGFLSILALHISRRITVTPRQKQKKTPAGWGGAYQSWNLITARGYGLHGWVVAARGASKGTVVMCHNYKASRQKLLPWIRFLNEGGYEVVAFDFNGHGESDRVHTFWGMVESMVLDLQTVIEHLPHLGLANPARIGIMAFSMGTAAVIGYLSAHAGRSGVKAIIFDSGPPHPSVWYSRVDLLLGRAFKRLPGVRLVHHLVRRWQSFKRYPEQVRHMPRAALEEGIPFLFIQGLKDRISVPAESRWMYDHLIHSPKEYWAVPEAHHMTIMALRTQEYQQRVLRFLDRHLARTAARGHDEREQPPRAYAKPVS